MSDARPRIAATEELDRLIGHQLLGVVGIEVVDVLAEADLADRLSDRLAISRTMISRDADCAPHAADRHGARALALLYGCRRDPVGMHCLGLAIAPGVPSPRSSGTPDRLARAWINNCVVAMSLAPLVSVPARQGYSTADGGEEQLLGYRPLRCARWWLFPASITVNWSGGWGPLFRLRAIGGVVVWRVVSSWQFRWCCCMVLPVSEEKIGSPRRVRGIDGRGRIELSFSLAGVHVCRRRDQVGSRASQRGRRST